ncbi:N-acetylmuramoyl-L-alanine amidase [Vermiphilus pyriformis]|jgi:N-acetylmuramoyl-L-alanine amidase|nr:MAG: N-acetylmuramoyl-L-alanine amidase [Vermiphilus pyriformis]
MNNLVKSLLITAFCTVLIDAKVVNPLLTDIFLHKVPENMLTSSLEIGKLVLYLTAHPVINKVEDTLTPYTQSKRRIEYIIPQLSYAQGEIIAKIKNIEKYKNKFYEISIESITKPVKGVKIAFIYDPALVEIGTDIFERINLEKGVAFYIYNKSVRTQLSTQTNSVLRTAYIPAKVPRILLDVGHGGSDTGACGHCNLVEKELTLIVAQHAQKILSDSGCAVKLTRVNDRKILLEDRTYMAHSWKADLIVSLHANWSPSAHVQGVETFYLDPSLFKTANHLSDNSHMYIQSSLAATKHSASKRLADLVHNYMVQHIQKLNPVLGNRKTKGGTYNVLLGANVPSALVEMGFVSSLQESQFLANPVYQKALAQGICQGILAYIHSA